MDLYFKSNLFCMISLNIVQISINLAKYSISTSNEGTQKSMPVRLKWSLYLTPCHKQNTLLCIFILIVCQLILQSLGDNLLSVCKTLSGNFFGIVGRVCGMILTNLKLAFANILPNHAMLRNKRKPKGKYVFAQSILIILKDNTIVCFSPQFVLGVH